MSIGAILAYKAIAFVGALAVLIVVCALGAYLFRDKKKDNV